MSTQLVPALTAPRRAKKLSSAERTLSSGLRVVVVRKPGVPLAELRLRVPFLSNRRGHAARSMLLSDTVLAGTSRLDRAGLAGAVQGLGGDLTVGVDADRLVVSGNVLASNLRGLLDLLAEVLTDARYQPREVGLEKQRAAEHLVIARSRSGVVAGEALSFQLFGDHPYSRELPQPDDVEAVTPAQLRKLHTDLVRPDGAVLVVVGDVSPARTLDQVEKALAEWAGSASGLTAPALPEIVGGPLHLLHRPGSVQSSLRMGSSAVGRDDPRYPALQLANTVFGGYFSSRWTENIREDKGYTYGPHSRIDHHILGSTLVLDADVATEVTAPALLETLYEMGRIASLPIKETELESVRQYAIGTLALSTATQAGLASTLVGLAGSGLDADWLAEHPVRLAKVTLDEVSAAAAEFFAPTRFVTVVVGDADAVSGPLGSLVELAP